MNDDPELQRLIAHITANPPRPPETGAEAERYWLLELIAAVDYLQRGIRPDLTIWEAIAEALHDWLASTGIGPATKPIDGYDEYSFTDALVRVVEHLDRRRDLPAADFVTDAVASWARATAGRFNAGTSWVATP
jgi:hypothetical protein